MDGRKQWSYKGYALYRYTIDRQPGDVYGSPVPEVFLNTGFEAIPDVASALAADLRTDNQLVLIWSHMYP